MDSQGGEDLRQGCGWRTREGKVEAGRVGSPIFVRGKTRGNNCTVRHTMQSRVLVWGNKASNSLTEKTCRGWGGGKNSQPHRSSVERPTGS